MSYKGKFKIGTGEKGHVIYDLKTGLAFGIRNEDDKPDSSRALIMCEYLNRVDVMAGLLAECQQALEHYGLSPATVAEIERHFDTWGQKAIEEKLPDKPGLYGKYIIKKANGEPTDPAAQYFVLRIDSDPHARHAIQAYAESIKDDNPALAEDLLRWSNAWERHDREIDLN
jgi:hypothetical protein